MLRLSCLLGGHNWGTSRDDEAHDLEPMSGFYECTKCGAWKYRSQDSSTAKDGRRPN